MTQGEITRLRVLTNKLMAVTGFDEQSCKVALWVEYQEGGMPYAERYVSMAVENSAINRLGDELLSIGCDPDEVLERLHAARPGGVVEMEKVAREMGWRAS